MPSGLLLINIGKRFGDTWVLRNIRASVPVGKITAFIGPNGAGKTTLFHVIAGAMRPDEGQITYKGQDITGMPAHAIPRLGIGRSFQDIRLFGGLNVLENVRIGLLELAERNFWRAWMKTVKGRAPLTAYRETAERWLEYVGLQDCRYRLARELSFGQQKLLSLARLFAKDFDFLLLDEPTAGLSFQMVERVSGLIRQVVEERGITVALVEHNMNVVKNLAYWIHFMHEGRVAFSGECDHVLGNRNVRELYMGL